MAREATAEPVAGLSEPVPASDLPAETWTPGTPFFHVPEVLSRLPQLTFLQEFTQEYAPVGPTESLLVAELARHAAAIDRWDAGSGAVERQAARQLPQLAGCMDQEVDPTMADLLLTTAMSSEGADRCERHSLLRSRAFLRTLDKLQAFQEARRRRTQRCTVLPPLGFADETACEEYLANRLRQSQAVCQQCGAAHGCVLQARKCWECAACGKQMGLRAGTVMARSPVPLRTWFDAVRWVLWRPTISATELSRQVGLERIATARSMLARIRTAMAAEDAGLQLAGLDQHYMRGADNNLSEVSSVGKASNAQN